MRAFHFSGWMLLSAFAVLAGCATAPQQPKSGLTAQDEFRVQVDRIIGDRSN